MLNDSNGFNPVNLGTGAGVFGPLFVPTPEPSTLSMAAIALLRLALTYVRKSWLGMLAQTAAARKRRSN